MFGNILNAVAFTLGVASLLIPGVNVATLTLLGAAYAASVFGTYANTGNLGFAFALGAFVLAAGGAGAIIAGSGLLAGGFAVGLLSLGVASLFGFS